MLHPGLLARVDVHSGGYPADLGRFTGGIVELGGLPGGLQRAAQYSFGVNYQLLEGMRASATYFHNLFFNLSDPLSLAATADEVDLDPRVDGQAVGVELLLRGNFSERLRGFLAYTLSRSERLTQVGRLPSAGDRSRVLNAALGYRFDGNWRLGGRGVVYSAIPRYIGTGVRSGRLPVFFRLDTRIEKRWAVGTQGAWWSVVFEVLNATLTEEVLGVDCGDDGWVDSTAGPLTLPNLAFEGA